MGRGTRAIRMVVGGDFVLKGTLVNAEKKEEIMARQARLYTRKQRRVFKLFNGLIIIIS